MYDITSSCADDFINHEEILDTLAYADQIIHVPAKDMNSSFFMAA